MTLILTFSGTLVVLYLDRVSSKWLLGEAADAYRQAKRAS
jgi:hypothetical protein